MGSSVATSFLKVVSSLPSAAKALLELFCHQVNPTG